MNPVKVEVVKNWQTPKNTKQVQQFLGLTNYFRKFIQGYSSMAAPLSELTKIKGEFDNQKDKTGKRLPNPWLPVHTQAFEALQTALTSSPVLKLPDFNSPFEVVVDASLLGTGAVLIQEGHPVAYSSKKYITAQK